MAGVSFKNLARSTAFAWLAEVWRIGSRLVLTPLILSQIGKPGYGVWTLVFSLSEYVSMMNSSFGVAYMRATAECAKLNDKARLEQILGAGMTAIGGLAVAATAGVWWFGAWLLAKINVPDDLIADGWIALMFVMASLVLRMSAGCALEVLAGLQRADLTYRLYILGSVVEFCVTLPLLWSGHGLVGMGAGYFVGQLVCIALAFVVAHKHAPGLRINPFLASRAGFREVVAMGGRFQLLGIVNTTVMQGVKLLLSVLLGVTSVAIYDLADKLINLGRSLSSSVLAPLLPAFADLQAGKEAEREQALFAQSSKVLALVSCATFGFLAALAHPVLLGWTGEDVPQAAIAVQLLAGGEIIMLQTGVVSASLRAQGRVRLELTMALLSAGTFALLIGPLFAWLAFFGVIAARAISQTGTGVWYLGTFLRQAKLSFRTYLRQAQLLRVLAVVAAATASAAATREGIAAFAATFAPRIGAAVSVATAAAPFTLLMLAGTWCVALTAAEREIVTAMVRRRLGRAPTQG